MKELDRFLRGAQLDPYQTRRLERLDEVALSNEAKRRRMASKVRDLMLLLFNEPMPHERLSAICGRTSEYWEGQLKRGAPSKDAVKLLTVGLRAHLFGLRDHINDIDRELAELTTFLDDRGCFPPPGTPKRRVPGRS